MKSLEEGINLKEIYGSSELNILMRTYPHNRSNRRIESMRLMPLPGMDTHVEMQADDAGFYELVAHQVFPCAAAGLWGSRLDRRLSLVKSSVPTIFSSGMR